MAMLVAHEGGLVGVVADADTVTESAKDAVSQLQECGVDVMIIAGDKARTARAIVEQFGVDDYRAEFLLADIVDAIDEVVEECDGEAMGATATDTALETADISLMGDDLSKLPYLYDLANDANGVIRQNIWASLGVKTGLALAVPFGYVPMWLAVLAHDVGMTTTVNGNTMRLSWTRPNIDDANSTTDG